MVNYHSGPGNLHADAVRDLLLGFSEGKFPSAVYKVLCDAYATGKRDGLSGEDNITYPEKCVTPIEHSDFTYSRYDRYARNLVPLNKMFKSVFGTLNGKESVKIITIPSKPVSKLLLTGVRFRLLPKQYREIPARVNDLTLRGWCELVVKLHSAYAKEINEAFKEQ